MNNSIQIKQLDELLLPCLRRNVKLKKYSTKQLTAAGENYGSLMIAVEIILEESNGLSREEVLNIVAKMCPPNEWIKKMFNTVVTFKKEIAMYNTVFPILTAFQREQGCSNVISFFPKCYGARINLNASSNVVDDDAILLLENLKLSGFELADRMKGFDLETAELIIKDLAAFHAVPTAIKILKPEIFKNKILPHLDKLRAFDCLSEDTEKMLMNNIIDTALSNDECKSIIERIKNGLQLCGQNAKNRPPPVEPFATINHNDYWVNNTMIKYKNGKPTENKMIDFQLIDYGSPGNDVIFFLFSSVQKEVLDVHYDRLVQLYYQTFIHTLKELKCETKPFTYELFQEELNRSAKNAQFAHILIMLRPIYSIKANVRELHELSEEDLLSEHQLSDLYKQKLPEIILEFAKKKWI